MTNEFLACFFLESETRPTFTGAFCTSRNACFIAKLNQDPDKPPEACPPRPYHPDGQPGDAHGFYFAGIGLCGRSGDLYVYL